jgi:hypothetical protein
MSEGARLVQLGTVGGSPINADVKTIGSAVPVAVTLSADYAMLDPPGFPFRASFTGAATPQYPHTVPSGTTISVLACEATALVAAGAAVLA